MKRLILLISIVALVSVSYAGFHFTPGIDGVKEADWPCTYSRTVMDMPPSNWNVHFDTNQDSFWVSNDGTYLYIGMYLDEDPWGDFLPCEVQILIGDNIPDAGPIPYPYGSAAMQGQIYNLTYAIIPQWDINAGNLFTWIGYQQYSGGVWGKGPGGEDSLDGTGGGVSIGGSAAPPVIPMPDVWTEFKIPLSYLGSPSAGDQIWIQVVGRAANNKPNFSEASPFDPACTPFGDPPPGLFMSEISYVLAKSKAGQTVNEELWVDGAAAAAEDIDGDDTYFTIQAAIDALDTGGYWDDGNNDNDNIYLYTAQPVVCPAAARVIIDHSLKLANDYTKTTATRAIVVLGNNQNEALQVNAPGSSEVHIEHLTLIPPYEADGLIGTGASNNYDGYELYRSSGTTPVTVYHKNCIFTGNASASNQPSTPTVALPDTADSTICSWGDDWIFVHSNVTTYFDSCIIAHSNDDAILSYSSTYFINSSKLVNNGGNGWQMLQDPNATSSMIGSASKYSEISSNAKRNTYKYGIAMFSDDPGVNTKYVTLHYVNVCNNGKAGLTSNGYGLFGYADPGDDVIYYDLQHCHFDNNVLGGAYFRVGSYSWIITATDCTFNNNGSQGVMMSRAAASSFDDCLFKDNEEEGMVVYGDSCPAPDISNSLFCNNGNHGGAQDLSNFFSASDVATAVTISDCTFHDPAGTVPNVLLGATADTATQPVIIVDCVFSGNGDTGIDMTNKGDNNVTIDHCDFASAGADGLAAIVTGGTPTYIPGPGYIGHPPYYKSVVQSSPDFLTVTNPYLEFANSTGGALSGWGSYEKNPAVPVELSVFSIE